MANPPRRSGPGRKQYLRWAIRGRYHSAGLPAAMDYLEKGFAKRGFTDKSLTEFSDYLQGYHDEYVQNNSKIIEQTALGDRISMSIGADFVLSGEIDRIDLTADGYAVWIVDKEDREWRDALRMPLLQSHYASEMGAPLAEVSVGFYFFDTQAYESARYTNTQVRSAVLEVTGLAKKLVTA
jgi:hypothetical protein